MAKNNRNLHSAKRAKNDEFYTLIEDVEAELWHYREHFRGKTVYLNCDDPRWSAFWRYFCLRFGELGLERLIATHYTGVTDPGQPSFKIEALRGRDDTAGDGIKYVDPETGGVQTALKGDGDFRSEECIELLEQADVVVTNPPFSCYSADTEVLTSSGWKLFADVADDDQIMSLNMATMEQEWTGFTERIQYRYDGELLHFKNRRMDLLVTPNHRMIARKGHTNKSSWYRDTYNDPVAVDDQGAEDLIRADEVMPQNVLPVRGFEWRGEHEDVFVLPGVTQKEQYSRREIEVPEKHIDMGDWLEFFGMWLADGCVRQGLNSQGNPRYVVDIKQSEANEGYILDLFDRIGFPCKISGNATGNHNYTVYSKQLWTYLNQFGKSQDKYVPSEILNLDAGLLERLWTGYVNGDSTGDAKQFRLTSVSRRLMEDMQQVILRVFGRLPQIRTIKAKYRGEPYEYYGISFSWGDKIWNSRYGVPDEVEYHDDVFCLTLERNGTMLVRRNGVVSWSGNCFREYVAQLVEHEKQFVILGNMNAITYKEVWPLIQAGDFWLGVQSPKRFIVGDTMPDKAGQTINQSGKREQAFGNIRWFTNLDHAKRHEELPLWKKYTHEEYPRYDEVGAINVDKVKEIPQDYDGLMGVPVTFLDKFNPDQFEIVGLDRYWECNPHPGRRFHLGGREVYARILIRNRSLTLSGGGC